jgi:hypothetical protein
MDKLQRAGRDFLIRLDARHGIDGAVRVRWRMSLGRLTAANCDRAQVPAHGSLVTVFGDARSKRHSRPDDLAALAWYYWLLVERVRSANATAEEKQPLLSEIELWFSAARRRCLTSTGWRWKRS